MRDWVGTNLVKSWNEGTVGMTKMLSSSSSSMNMGSIIGDCVAEKKNSHDFSDRFKCYKLTGCCLSCSGSGSGGCCCCSSGCGSCCGCCRCCGGGNGGIRTPQPEGIRPISAQ